MNVPNWFPVWFSSSRVPITSTPTFRRWAVAPGNHENSSASSRLPVLVCWGSPLLPPNASATTVSPPVGRADPTSTNPDGSVRNAVASRRWRATYPRSSLMKCPPKNEVSEAMTPPPRVVRVPPVAGRARLPTRVGSWDSQLPSSRRVRVWTSLACQSSRSRPRVLFVARSPESFFFNNTAPTEIYTLSDTLSLHDALPILDVHDLDFLPDLLDLRGAVLRRD